VILSVSLSLYQGGTGKEGEVKGEGEEGGGGEREGGRGGKREGRRGDGGLGGGERRNVTLRETNGQKER